MEITNLAENTEDFTGNIWLIRNSETVLIDAGTGDSWKNIRQLDSIDKVVLTHSHYDHTDNLAKIKEKFEPVIYAYQPENLSLEAVELKEDRKIEICKRSFQIFHTPGHKDDSICLYSPGEKILFTGDLIFPEGGFGRTDLEEGDRDLLIESIEKIAELDVRAFYPGHGRAVTEDPNEWIEKSLSKAKKHEPKY